MRKHTNVDILAELKKLVDTHVRHYKEDFEVDRKFITQTAKDALPEDRTLIWFCRECGTHCFREAQTFIRDTREHNTLRFYAEQSGEDITARIVVPKQLKGKKVMGDVYEVSFKELAFKVAQNSLEPVTSRMTFEDGSSAEVPFHKSLRSADQLVQEHGRITSIHVIPVDKEALADILAQQKRRRERLPEAADHAIRKSAERSETAKPDKHTSIREKLSQAKKEQPSRKAVPDKSKGKDLEL